MSVVKVSLLGIAVLIGGWLIFDGIRAFVTGDYTTPRSGPYAGRLGPWSHVVSVVGLEPRGNAVKCLHVGLGLLWLASVGCFLARPTIGWWALLISSGCTLWYLPIGTVLAVIEICILLSPSIRSLR